MLGCAGVDERDNPGADLRAEADEGVETPGPRHCGAYESGRVIEVPGHGVSDEQGVDTRFALKLVNRVVQLDLTGSGGQVDVGEPKPEIAHLALRPGLDPAVNAAACYVRVPDADMWHARLAAAGLPVSDLRAEPWGMTEFRVEDPSGNLVRVGRSS